MPWVRIRNTLDRQVPLRGKGGSKGMFVRTHAPPPPAPVLTTPDNAVLQLAPKDLCLAVWAEDGVIVKYQNLPPLESVEEIELV